MNRTTILLAGAIPLALAGGWWLGAARAPAAAPAAEQAQSAEEAHDDKPEAIVLDAAQVRAAGIEVEPVGNMPFAGEVTASGRIVPASGSQAAVTARAGGTVVRLLRGLGDRVGPGTALAVLDSREAAEARAAHAKAVRAQALAEATYAREDRLYRERVTAAQDFQAAAAARDGARLDTRLAAEAMRAIGASAGGDLRRLTVVSPVAGAIVAVETTTGATVEAATTLFRVADQRVVWAELLVPARDLVRLSRGGRARVTAQGEAHDHAGRIVALGPTIDSATGAATAIVAIADHGGELAVGKLVSARLPTAASARGPVTLSVPRDALQQIEGRTVVFVRTVAGFAPREVTVGPGTGPRAQVLGGLAAGDRIAVANSFILKAELGKSEAEHDH